MSEDRSRLIRVARGLEPADLLLRGGRIINVFSATIDAADIAIADGRIAGIGPGYTGRETIDLAGAFAAPGLIDAHVHIESSLCTPAEFAAAVVPRGVTTAIIDPHEIANVAGLAGVRYMADAARDIPLRVKIMAPSCVPATHLAVGGATLDAAELAELLRDGTTHGLAEVMNFPGVLNADPAVAAKLNAYRQRPIDGHAPGVLGKDLCGYIAAGIGSDHECVSVEEAQEKLNRGLYILIREATNAHNLTALLPLITPANSRRICFCTDDRQPADLLDEGSIDHMIRVAIAGGVDPMIAFQCATLNTAEWFGLHDRGAIAPGRLADLMIFDDLKSPRPRLVFVGGNQPPSLICTHKGEGGGEGPRVRQDDEFKDGDVQKASSIPSSRSIAVSPSRPLPSPLPCEYKREREKASFAIRATGKTIRVIGHRPDQLITDHLSLPATIVDGQAVSDPHRDILKMAVINRHGRQQVGLGFIRGIGLKRGAIAGTVAHDHHNLIVIGVDDVSMHAAIAAVGTIGGGLVAVDGDQTLADLPLLVAGLMSDRPIAEVRERYDQLLAAAKRLGSPLHDPFMAMSFSALEVIPSLKLTDLGLVDVDRFELVDLFVG